MPALLAALLVRCSSQTRVAPSKATFFFRCLDAASQCACSRAQANTKKDQPMFLSTILTGINRWFRYRETLRELSGLTDRELDDLGINRDDIASVAWRGR